VTRQAQAAFTDHRREEIVMRKHTLRGAEWLRAELDLHQLSIRQLARLAGMSDATLRAILRGGQADQHTFARLATALVAHDRLTAGASEPDLHRLERRLDELETRLAATTANGNGVSDHQLAAW
jgi:transcriptional regulator with XRE-family HTH domain